MLKLNVFLKKKKNVNFCSREINRIGIGQFIRLVVDYALDNHELTEEISISLVIYTIEIGSKLDENVDLSMNLIG